MTSRRIAFNVLSKVTIDGSYANLALKEALLGAEQRQASEVTALVYNTLERINHADFLIAHYARGRLHGSIRMILRMGIAELLYMSTPAHAVCDESVKLTKAIGKTQLSGFVNAVLRRINRERDALPRLPDCAAERYNILYGVPVFMADEYISLYGEAFTEKLLSCMEHRFVIRAQYPFGSDELETYLKNNGISYRRGELVHDAFILDKGIDLGKSKLFADGRITVQSESAMLASLACGAKAGSHILDACGAPGGKSAYLASIMRNEGRIVLWDIHQHRVELAKKTLARLNVSIADVILHDATVFVRGFANAMDAVLIDAPCSGFGGGTKPDAYLNRTEQNIIELADIQSRILDTCCKYVRPGGTLVYSTCTISKRENEDNVIKFLERHAEFVPDTLQTITRARANSYADLGMIQLFPNIDETEGFFIACMKKRNEAR